MTADIQTIAVIGSGVMGSGIAAHIANAGYDVLLFDIVPDGAEDRNVLAKGAVDKMLKANPCPFAHKANARRVTPCNMEDDLARLGEADWIIEVVLERIDIKHATYAKIQKHRKPGSVVSSNTSTLPLKQLVEGMDPAFAKDFMITHFFNPPRFLRLLELVVGPDTDAKQVSRVREFLDVNLGKGVVDCNDTPGFIANRIGCYWLVVGLLDAIELGISVEEADLVMGRPVGIPKTGVFGLYDLIGIDLMPLIAQSMLASLPKEDAFCLAYDLPKLVEQMIADGYTGRKGKGGFYRLNKEGGKKTKEAKNLKTGDYAPAAKPKLASVEAAKAGLANLVQHEDIGGQYAWAVLSKTLSYTASLLPEIAGDIRAVDQAMRDGYNWKYGPFELIDRMAADGMAGPAWFAKQLEVAGMEVPALLKAAGDKPFYATQENQRVYLNLKGDYDAIPLEKDAWRLSDVTLGAKPVLKNGSAALWDVGDGIACFQLTSKMNSIDPDILKLLSQSIDVVGNDFKGMIIGGDGDNFSVGANLGFILYASNLAAWDMIEGVIADGQNCFMKLKYAPFPVVSALHGMALGGGCEMTLHCDAIQAHIESYIGLVEVGVGVIPGWGGCKELLVRGYAEQARIKQAMLSGGRPQNPAQLAHGPMPVIIKAFETISLARVAGSAQEARDMLILREGDAITMNRLRLLADAKSKCLTLSEGYTPPEAPEIYLPGETARVAMEMAVDGFVQSGKATPHDETVCKALAEVLSGGDTDITDPLTEQDLLDLEREVFVRLIRTEPTLARIEHMLNTGKPLRN